MEHEKRVCLLNHIVRGSVTQTLAANILQLRESDDGTPNLEIRHDIKAVWHDPIMSTLLRRQNEYNLLDSAH